MEIKAHRVWQGSGCAAGIEASPEVAGLDHGLVVEVLGYCLIIQGPGKARAEVFVCDRDARWWSISPQLFDEEDPEVVHQINGKLVGSSMGDQFNLKTKCLVASDQPWGLGARHHAIRLAVDDQQRGISGVDEAKGAGVQDQPVLGQLRMVPQDPDALSGAVETHESGLR